jgi:hypothetical protein
MTNRPKWGEICEMCAAFLPTTPAHGYAACV